MFQLSALTEEQRIQKSAITIMAHPKWATTGGVLMVGERRICDETPTAYTNGKDVVFGRAACGQVESDRRVYGSLTCMSRCTKPSVT
jgi:hypothetical protein